MSVSPGQDRQDDRTDSSFLLDLRRRDHWHYALSCEKAFCGASFVLQIGVRHHCRGCGLSLCANHSVRHTANPFTHQLDQKLPPFWLCGMCDLRLQAKAAQLLREQQQQQQQLEVAKTGDSDGESSVADSVCYSVFDNDSDALNTSKEEGR